MNIMVIHLGGWFSLSNYSLADTEFWMCLCRLLLFVFMLVRIRAQASPGMCVCVCLYTWRIRGAAMWTSSQHWSQRRAQGILGLVAKWECKGSFSKVGHITTEYIFSSFATTFVDLSWFPTFLLLWPLTTPVTVFSMC